MEMFRAVLVWIAHSAIMVGGGLVSEAAITGSQYGATELGRGTKPLAR